MEVVLCDMLVQVTEEMNEHPERPLTGEEVLVALA